MKMLPTEVKGLLPSAAWLISIRAVAATVSNPILALLLLASSCCLDPTASGAASSGGTTGSFGACDATGLNRVGAGTQLCQGLSQCNADVGEPPPLDAGYCMSILCPACDSADGPLLQSLVVGTGTCAAAIAAMLDAGSPLSTTCAEIVKDLARIELREDAGR
jgi:hypothetical protein